MAKYSKQRTNFTCACASLKNIIFHLTGETISEELIREKASTTKEGTSSKEILRAVKYFGFYGKIWILKTETAFKNRLDKIFKNGGCAIVTVDHDRHVVALVGLDKGTAVIAESDKKVKKMKITYKLKDFQVRACNIDIENPKGSFYEIVEVCEAA